MNKKIILFDIDGTIFNSKSFINNFYKKLSRILKPEELKKFQDLYKENKNENGYFSPEAFLNKISDNFRQLSKTTLKKIFWNVDLYNKNVYKDASVIKDLSRVSSIGIFSKGDEYFQKQKISFISDIIEAEDMYIFKNKLDKINEVLENYRGEKVYLIDDEIEVLEKVKSLNPEVYTILIDRNNKHGDLDIIKIKSLTELKSLIYD